MSESLRKFIVANSFDTSRCDHNLPYVHLFYRINENGTLQRAQSYSLSRKNIMGIYDGGGLSSCDIEKLIYDIITELNRKNYIGVLFDFCEDPSTIEKIGKMCSILTQKHILHFLPVSLAPLSSDAKLIIPSSISGGSFSEMISYYVEKYPSSRLCLELIRCRNKFSMPSYKPEGVFLTNEDFSSIIKNFNPSSFFSEELACKYFTYRDEDQTSFVLYDDHETAIYKIKIVEKANFYSAFILYSEWGEYSKSIINTH